MNDVQREKYQVMPALPAEDYEALKADIAARGVMVAVEVDEYGNILDGYNRIKVCRELGINDYPIVVRSGLSEAEKLTHARPICGNIGIDLLRTIAFWCHIDKRKRGRFAEPRLLKAATKPSASFMMAASTLGSTVCASAGVAARTNAAATATMRNPICLTAVSPWWDD